MPLDPSCGHTAGACLCADLDRMSIPAIEEYLRRRRQIDAATRMAERDKALREPPTASVEPGSGYAARRATGEGGHGMATRWRPTVGARVVTAMNLNPARPHYVHYAAIRKPGATGTVLHEYPLMICHDGQGENEVPYDADELAPAPEVSK